MSFSRGAATGFVPLMARVVLAAAFIGAGWQKFQMTTFEPAQADQLRSMGIDLQPVTGTGGEDADAAAEENGETARLYLGNAVIRQASFQANEPDEPAADDPEADEPAADEDDEATNEPPTIVIPDDPAEGDLVDEMEDAVDEADDATGARPGATAGATGEPGRARGLHHVTIMLDKQGWPQPVWMARLAAATELVGGVLILLGFLTRIWGLGLAITMVVAFYMTTWGLLQDLNYNYMSFVADVDNFNRAFAQLGLFALAFGVFLTGPGPVSVDRLLFKSKQSEQVDDTF